VSAYREAVMALNPVAYWRLGEPSGYIALDQLWDHHGTYNGTVTLDQVGALAGDGDTSALFHGTADWMEVPDHADLNVFEGVTPWSVAGWVNVTHDATERMIFNKLGAGAAAVQVRSGDFLIPYRGDAAAGDTAFLDPLTPGWHHIAVTFSGTAVTLYLDTAIPPGNFGTTNPFPSTRTVPNLTSGLGFAGNPGSGGQGLVGGLDDLAVFDFALSQAQVDALFLAGDVGATGFDAIALAIADRFLASVLTAPAGLQTVRGSTANPPNQMPPLPYVMTFLDSGAWTHVTNKRDGVHRATVRFYFNQAGPSELARDMPPLRQWLDVLNYQLRDSTQLGGLVSLAVIDTWSIGILDYAGQPYTGIELGVRFVTNEGWAAVA
jgi:hypothetical protein